MRNLIFVGLPGSGKSTVGRLCAKALNLPFVDADKFLEQREGRSVADIFASSGEGYFRDLESRVLAELCRREGIVLATGGGAVLRRENRRLLRDGAWSSSWTVPLGHPPHPAAAGPSPADG